MFVKMGILKSITKQKCSWNLHQIGTGNQNGRMKRKDQIKIRDNTINAELGQCAIWHDFAGKGRAQSEAAKVSENLAENGCTLRAKG